MRSAILLALAFAAAPAAAQPGPRPTCAVSIVRAPDDVRAVVEEWVRAEPRCTSTLEVRIVPTEGGLYLLARDEAGHVRERVVPDAQSAGVLVASWVAADSMPAPVAPVAAPAPVPPSVMLGREGLLAPGEGAAPGLAPVIATAAPAAPPRWLALGGLVAMSGTGGGGLRGEADLVHRGILSFGLAASATQSGMMVYGATYEEMGTLDTFDAKGIAYAGLDAAFGRWHLRTAVGAGVVYTRAQLDQPGLVTYRVADGVFPAGEASLTLGRELGASWGIDIGPVVSLYIQEYEIETSGDYYTTRRMQRRDLESMFFMGVRHRL